jgi:hypothetical protein
MFARRVPHLLALGFKVGSPRSLIFSGKPNVPLLITAKQCSRMLTTPTSGGAGPRDPYYCSKCKKPLTPDRQLSSNPESEHHAYRCEACGSFFVEKVEITPSLSKSPGIGTVSASSATKSSPQLKVASAADEPLDFSYTLT